VANDYTFFIRGKDRTAGAFSSLKNSLTSTTKAAAGLAAAFGLNELKKAADEWTNINNKLRLVTDSETELIDVRGKLLALSAETRSELDTTVTLYARLQRATEEANLSQTELLEITKAVNQSFAISGATIAESSASITQLTQALASGVLRGQEFNSISEQAPRLLEALTDSLNVTRGELREMAKDGRLTSDIVINAIKGSSQAIAKEFATAIPTASQALTVFGTALTVAIGKLDEATGASNTFSQAILGISAAIQESVGGVETLDSMGIVLDRLLEKRNQVLTASGPNSENLLASVNDAIVEATERLEILKDKLASDKASQVTVDVIFEGLDLFKDSSFDDLFTPLSESAGGVGQEAAKEYADQVYGAFQSQLDFNKQSAGVNELFEGGGETFQTDYWTDFEKSGFNAFETVIGSVENYNNAISRIGQKFGDLQNFLAAENNPAELARQQLQARLEVIQEYYALESVEAAKATQAGIASLESYKNAISEGDLFSSLSDSLSGLANQVSGTLGQVALGMTEGDDAARALATTILTELTGAMINYGIEQVVAYATGAVASTASEAAKTTAVVGGIGIQTTAAVGATGALTVAGVASGTTIAAAMAPAAAATSIATAGAAPAVAAPIALSTIGAIIAALVGGVAIAGSFEGGGYIPNGPRSGGLDGRGGQLAMVHPDESIIDHKSSSNNTNNNNNNNETNNTNQGNKLISFTFAPVINSRRPGDIIDELETVKKPFIRMIQSAINEPL
jgi:tape measure domain-containing protein